MELTDSLVLHLLPVGLLEFKKEIYDAISRYAK